MMEGPAQMVAGLKISQPHAEPLEGPGPEQALSSRARRNHVERPGRSPEEWHVSFRSFTPSRDSDPVQDLRRISELCRLWLRPDLHTKEEILDQIILEQFLISMPEDLQVLVMESGVRRCQDLEEMLKSHQKPQKWSIVVSEGQKFLLWSPEAQLAEAAIGESDNVLDLSTRCPSSTREAPPQRSQADLQLQSPPEGQRPGAQGEHVLPEPVPEQGDLHILGEELREDGEEAPAQRSPEPQLLQRPADSVRNPQDVSSETVPARTPPAHSGQGEGSVEDPQDSPMPSQSKRRRRNRGPGSQEASPEAHPDGEGTPLSGQGGRQLVAPQGPAPPGGPPAGEEAAGAARHECGECHKSFRYRSQLAIHRRSHSGERPFECGHCGKCFLQASDLRVHQRVHTGERPFACATCHKQFAHESTLRGHRRLHTHEKPFECADCKKRFSHKGNLNSHRRIHTQAMPYPCDVCGRAFRQLGTRNRHRQTHA